MANPGSTRAAQAWAKLYMEKIDDLVHAESKRLGGVQAALPLDLPLMDRVSKGQGIRFCQEINLAKKQQDSREYAKRDESARKLEILLQKGSEAGEAYRPRVIAWVLRAHTPAEDGTVGFYACLPTGGKRAQSKMLDLAIAFAIKMGEPEDESAKKVDPFAGYFADVPAPRKISQASPSAPTPPIPASPDAQEDLLSRLYGKEEGE